MLSFLFFELSVSFSKPHKYTKFDGEMQIFRVIYTKIHFHKVQHPYHEKT